MAITARGGFIFGLGGAALTCTALSGYVSPSIISDEVGHDGSFTEVKSQSGEITGFIVSGESLSRTFSIIPEGTTVANAKLAAGLPTLGAAFGITGLAIVAAGLFTDAFNTNGANTQPWFYVGGGKYTISSDGHMSLSLPLRRFFSITSSSPVT